MRQSWQAQAAEKKGAMLVAGICMAMVIVFLVWPSDEQEVETLAPEVLATLSSPVMESEDVPPVVSGLSDTNRQEPVPQKDVQPKKTVQPSSALPIPAAEPASQPKPIMPISPPPVEHAKPMKLHAKSIKRIEREGYFLQVGAFKTEKYAERMLKRVEAKGFPSAVFKKSRGLYAVQLGPYATSVAAKKAQKVLKRAYHMDGFVLHRKLR